MQLKQIKILPGLILLVCIISIYSCKDNAVAPANLPQNCDTTNLTYTNTMQVLIEINCGTMNTSCHSPGTGSNRDFSTYASLQSSATGGQSSKFWQQIFIQKKMPLYPELPLDLCTSNQFKVWLLNGAPQ